MRKMNKLLISSKLFLKRNASTILTGIGAGGVIATTIMAVKATPTAMVLLEEAEEEKGEELTTLETVQIAAPAYIPTIVTGAATIACIFGANALNKRQQAALMSAYALLDNSYREYKKKVGEIYGDEAHDTIRTEIAKGKREEGKPVVKEGQELFYDEFSGRYFNATNYDVSHAEYCINRDIQTQGWATLNDFYEYIGVDPVDGGDALGWSEGGNYAKYWQSWVDFNHHHAVLDDGLEVCILSFFEEPYLDYEMYS